MEPVESGDPHAQRKVDNELFKGGHGRGGGAYRIKGILTLQRKGDSAAGTWMML